MMMSNIFSQLARQYNFVDAQKLLIPPFERIRFIIFFVTVTISINLGYSLIPLGSYFIPLWLGNQSEIAMLFTFSMLLGVAQWLVIRRYVPDRKWILVVFFSVILAEIIRAGIGWLGQSFSSAYLSENSTPLQQAQLEFAFLGTVAALIGFSVIILNGYLQWRILRRYVVHAKWWIFMPLSIGVILALISYLPFLLINIPGAFFPIKISILRLSILPIAQAICFCLLERKKVSEQNMQQSPLALSADVTDYWQTQKLKRQLRSKMRRLVLADQETTMTLNYLVGISDRGEIHYEPIDQAAIDCVGQTPLPQLTENTKNLDGDIQTSSRFAKFKVVFSPPGIVHMYAWRGVPLQWIVITICLGLIAISHLF
jgi:hypothetical protein